MSKVQHLHETLRSPADLPSTAGPRVEKSVERTRLPHLDLERSNPPLSWVYSPRRPQNSMGVYSGRIPFQNGVEEICRVAACPSWAIYFDDEEIGVSPDPSKSYFPHVKVYHFDSYLLPAQLASSLPLYC
ncbi:hypothetical protein CsSME_00014672 [Camellia sinensis var. sinensis]